jgi:hypothetical protein
MRRRGSNLRLDLGDEVALVGNELLAQVTAVARSTWKGSSPRRIVRFLSLVGLEGQMDRAEVGLRCTPFPGLPVALTVDERGRLAMRGEWAWSPGYTSTLPSLPTALSISSLETSSPSSIS